MQNMSNEVTIQHLPDEMLEKILLQLRLEDRKSALRVCKRWSALAPFDLPSVQLVIDADLLNDKKYQDYYRALLVSSRRYKHVVVYVSEDFDKLDLIFEILGSFSESLRSLKFNFKPIAEEGCPNYDELWPMSKLIVFAKITTLSSNLQHLQINECMFDSDGSDLEFSSMNNLDELYLKNHLMPLIPNMHDITPNITRLHMYIGSEESLNFLRHVSSQLVELEIWFLPGDDFLAVCTMQFPLLEKLTFFLPLDLFNDVNSNGIVDRFLQKLPALKGLTIGNLLNDRVGNLCKLQSCENIQFLCLRYNPDGLIKRMDADDIRAICKLKHLKRLQIASTPINVPDVFDFQPLQSLEMLSLDGVTIDQQFKRFRQYTFPRLVTCEILSLSPCDEDDNVDLFGQYDILCSDMPCITQLGIIEKYVDVQLGRILKFGAICRELRLKCRSVLDTDSLDELRPIPVETLIMEVKYISLESLQKLIKSMAELKRLELAFSPDDTISLFKPDYTMDPETIQMLRVAFPRCQIVEKLRVQLKEPLW